MYRPCLIAAVFAREFAAAEHAFPIKASAKHTTEGYAMDYVYEHSRPRCAREKKSGVC